MTETEKPKTTTKKNDCENCLNELKKLIRKMAIAIGVICMLIAILFNTLKIEKLENWTKKHEKITTELQTKVKKLNITVFNKEE